MQAQIEQRTMGYRVRLSPCTDFAAMLELFKSTIPKKCRQFNSATRYWFVDRRAQRRLEQFIDALTNAGGEVQR